MLNFTNTIGTIVVAFGLAMASSSAMAGSLDHEQADDPTVNGERHLGINISDVELTQSGVQEFLQTLPAGGQHSVIGACQNQAAWGGASKAKARAAVMPFCAMVAPTIAAGFGG